MASASRLRKLYQVAQEMVERFDSNPIYATKRARENTIVAALESVEEHEREACATQIELTPASVFMGNKGDERAFISRDDAAAAIRAREKPGHERPYGD